MSALNERFMQAALAYGRRGLGRTATNPAVGALVVRDGIIIGRGFTQDGGRPHAEPVALAEAGAQARGATLYVTLEPCSHHGKTPPCAEAIIASGIARVVSAMPDPDARVSGRGHALLRAAGIEVVVGPGEGQARRDHRGHICRVTRQRPMITLKLARSADGFAGAPAGQPRLMISGAAAMGRTHMLRALHDGVMIGIGTALADDPQLSVRLPGMTGRQPMRIVLDAQARLPPGARLADGTASVLLACGPQAPAAARARWQARGVTLAEIATSTDGRLDLVDVMARLFQQGLTRVFCEGGPTLAHSLLVADLVDEVLLVTNQQLHAGAGFMALDAAGQALVTGRFRRYQQMHAGVDLIEAFEREDK
ncbi:MAG: bifunctional diaminohydroxyphosphoribosylaminopyrimidine deaminase/5-amino-6-(5-phosphoribosylamino)uracil reductase RibD [Hyphomicrobiales bacterium]|nr:bifunctional diaminohydroxyphosphoribosylaminopyrimidine deaminase/5-amino-6-(5-phosphoribosylamino)uracil reductase RibD [Hyphomicrobiales bacterium]